MCLSPCIKTKRLYVFQELSGTTGDRTQQKNSHSLTRVELSRTVICTQFNLRQLEQLNTRMCPLLCVAMTMGSTIEVRNAPQRDSGMDRNNLNGKKFFETVAGMSEWVCNQD